MSLVVDRLATLGLLPWPEPLALTAADVSALCSTAPHEGLVALLGAALELGVVDADDAAVSVVSTEWAERMAWCVQLDTVLLGIGELLAGAGIDMRVLKGVAIATLDEPDAAWRSYGDVDVLVPADRFLDAVDVLATAGWRPAVPPVSRRWLGAYAKSVTLVDGSGVQVDLHRMLAAGVLGTRVRMAAVLAERQPFTVGGATFHALAPVHRFLHACYHAVLGGVAGARHRRDVLLLAHQVVPTEVEARLGEGWSGAVVVKALRWAGAGGGLPEAWADWTRTYVVDPADRSQLADSLGSFRDGAAAHVRAIAGPVAKVRYLAALVWPTRGHLAARGRSRPQHLRRLAESTWHRRRSQ